METHIMGIDGSATARNRVKSGAMPDWVTKCPYDSEFKSEQGSPQTYLLFDRQIHAELHQTYVHVALRLETMEAVQHYGQWRLQFQPKTQSYTLHLLKIRRGEAEFDQLNLETTHFLQREEGLEQQVIGGWFTVIQVLEDLRSGDVLEWAHTLEATLPILPNSCTSFFELPEGRRSENIISR